MDYTADLLQKLLRDYSITPEIIEKIASTSATVKENPEAERLLRLILSESNDTVDVPSFDLQEFLSSQGISLEDQTQDFREKADQLTTAFCQEMNSIYMAQEFLCSKLKEVQNIGGLSVPPLGTKEIERIIAPTYERIVLDMQNFILQLIAKYGSQKKKPHFPVRANPLLCKWFDNHLDHPYPTNEEKGRLAVYCGISVDQVSVWFYNERARRHSRKRKGDE